MIIYILLRAVSIMSDGCTGGISLYGVKTDVLIQRATNARTNWLPFCDEHAHG